MALPAHGGGQGAVRGLAKSPLVEWGQREWGWCARRFLARTPALDRAYAENPALEARLAQVVPLGRVGDCDTDIAPVVVFSRTVLRYITGCTVVVDGGRFTTL